MTHSDLHCIYNDKFESYSRVPFPTVIGAMQQWK
jgi:hypothetical protein